jgi:hypothetical protein
MNRVFPPDPESVRSCPSFPQYHCDRVGRVYLFRHGAWFEVKQSINSEGYLRVHVRHPGDGRMRLTRVHRMIADAFYGPSPTPDHLARHLNDIRTDNRAENIAWGTRSENAQDASRNGRTVRRLSFEQAEDIRRRYASGDHGVTALAVEFGVSNQTVRGILLGIYYKSAGGEVRDSLCRKLLISEDVKKDIQQRIIDGESQASVASALGLSRVTICHIVNGKMGLPAVPHKSRGGTRRFSIDQAKLIQKSWEDGRSAKEIARDFATNVVMVSNIVRGQYGLPACSQRSSRGRPRKQAA